MSVASEITRLQNAKASIKTSIENKGVTVGDGTIDTYASKIDEISTSSAVLGTKTITANGTYKAIDDNLDGYSQVTVETSGVNLDEYFKPTITSQGTYKGAWGDTLIKFRSPLTVVGTNGEYLFYNYPLAVLPEIDTSNITIFTSLIIKIFVNSFIKVKL